MRSLFLSILFILTSVWASDYRYYPPEPRSINYITDNPVSKWNNKNFEVYKWDKIPTVLVFDTIDYAYQDLMFKRLAFFVEKKGYIGEIYDPREIKYERGWNGHDYRAYDLAIFFSKAASERVELTDGEEILLDILIKNSIIKYSYGGFIPISGAIISCSRSSGYNHRKTILKHEALHGIYFTDSNFRELSESVWNKQSSDAKKVWILYMDYLNYNTEDTYLVINEFMAYLLQVTREESYIYFKNTVFYRLYYDYPSERDSINRFFSNNRTPYREAIIELGNYTSLFF